MRAVMHANLDARYLRYTRARIAWSPTPKMRTIMHANHGARELRYTRATIARSPTPQNANCAAREKRYTQAAIHGSYDCMVYLPQKDEQ